jgi:hypothetical protein
VTFSRCFAVCFVLGGAGAFGCSGENEGGDEDGDETGGSNAGFTAMCLSVCERTNECPNAAPQDCAESCSTFNTQPCATEHFLVLDCLSRGDVCDPLPPECSDEIYAYDVCMANVDRARCSPDDAPPSASCEAICSGGAFHCFEPETETACVESCSNGAARSELVACSDEYQTMIACFSTCADFCALTPDDCTEARSGFLDCDAAFCEANPDSEPCRIETI